MDTKRTLRFFKTLLEDESLLKPDSPFRYGISLKSAKRILDSFSKKLVGKPEIIWHYTQKSVLLRIKTNYLTDNKVKTYILTIETNKDKKFKNFIKEYFYLKFIFRILFHEEHITTKEIIEQIKVFS